MTPQVTCSVLILVMDRQAAEKNVEYGAEIGTSVMKEDLVLVVDRHREDQRREPMLLLVTVLATAIHRQDHDSVSVAGS